MKIKNNVYYKSSIKNSLEINGDSQLDLLIIDNFYKDPYKIREIALAQEYKRGTYYPGMRSKSFASEELKEMFQCIINDYGCITNFPINNNESTQTINNGSFNYCTTEDIDTGWIHTDHPHNLVGLIYLTPDPPLVSGTKFYQYNNESEKHSYYNEKIDKVIKDSHFNKDISKWKLIDIVGNVFNRLVLFNSRKYHLARDFFGTDINNGRLTQNFWFSYDNTIKMYKEIKNNYYNYWNCNLIVINNFYKDPMEVRNIALSQEYLRNEPKYPGNRTRSYATLEIKERIKKYLLPFGKITCFHLFDDKDRWTDNGNFQFATAEDKSWIHCDHPTDWAGVIYLTPDAPFSSGTNFYRYNEEPCKNIDARKNDIYLVKNEVLIDYNRDMTKWDVVDSAGNVFNRLILFNSKRYHMSGDYFGTNINNGRLFQVFFFKTEKHNSN